jgi:hypothetical protein
LKNQDSEPGQIPGVLDRLNTGKQQPCRADDRKDHDEENHPRSKVSWAAR